MGYLGKLFQVGYIELGIPDRLGIKCFGLGCYGLSESIQVMGVYKLDLYP